MKTITNIHVDSLSHDGKRAAACWEQDGCRFHFWIEIEAGTVKRDAEVGPIYKNPLLGIERGQPGHFDSRKIDPSAPKNVAILAHVFEAIDSERLVAKAIAADKQARRDEAERRRQAAISERRSEFARLLNEMWEADREELLDALSDTLCMADIDELQARLP